MKKTSAFFIRHYLFLAIVFIVFRVAFILMLSHDSRQPGYGSLVHALVAGYRLDWSAASYLAVFPLCMTAVLAFGGDRFVFASVRWYYYLLVTGIVLLSISNIIVFAYWGTLLNNRALAFVSQPREMLASVTNTQLAALLLLLTMLVSGSVWFFRKFLYPAYTRISGTRTQRLIVLLAWLVFIGIGIRGGVQLIPVNESSAAFSIHRSLNQAAINNIWYLGHNLAQSGLNEENPYKWMDDSTAAHITGSLLQPGKNDAASPELFPGASRPNVVIVMLESWTADIIEPLGGIRGVTPEFTSIAKDGLLFTRIFSSGFRTDQALTSVLSGFPAQPNRSIIRFPEKTAQLPCLPAVLGKQGYSVSFFYGGETGFANMNSYLKGAGVEHIVDIGSFPHNDRNSKWGVHDGYVFERMATDLAHEKQPFFSVMLTLSTHEPFEVPVPTPYNGTSESERFKKAAWYTDQCLGAWFRNIRQAPWFRNSIIILVADHGHRLPLNRDYFDPALRHIPLLVVSPLLRPDLIGDTLGMTGNQHDLVATLLAGLHLPHDSFEWSNNLLHPHRNDFAYLSLDNAFTWLTDSDGYVVPLEPGLAGYGTEIKRQRTAKAYLQHLYGRFTGY